MYRKGIAFAVLSAVCFSIMPILAVHAYLGGVSTTTVLLIRFLIASMILGLHVAATHKHSRITKRDWASFALLGGGLYTLQAVLHFESVRYLSPSLAVLILFTYPLFVVAIPLALFGKKLSRTNLIGMFVALSGLAFVLLVKPESVELRGLCLAFGAALVYAIYTLFGSAIVKQQSPIITCTFVTLFAAFGILCVGLIKGDIGFSFDQSAWFPILGIALVSTVIADLSFFAALRSVGPTKTSVIGMVEPIFTAIFSLVVLQDDMNGLQYMGMILVVLGCVIVIGTKEKKEILDFAKECR